MDYERHIALNSGHAMPAMGLGTWQLTEDTAGTVVAALALGYRMIDTSGDYGTQPGIAEGLRRSGINRADIFLVTKIEEDEDAYEATSRNLRELGTDFADLVLIHRPPENGAGEKLWRGLMRARADGLARDIGVSNYSIELIDSLIAATGEIPAVNQIEWSPFGHSGEMLGYAEGKDMIIQAYSPLTRTEQLDDGTLAAIARKYDKSPAQLMIRWNLQNGTVPLPKANRRDHLEDDIDVFDFDIDVSDMMALDRLNAHYSALGKLPYV